MFTAVAAFIICYQHWKMLTFENILSSSLANKLNAPCKMVICDKKIACIEFISLVVWTYLWTSYLTSCVVSHLFLLLIYFNWNYFVMRSNTIRRAWVDLLSKCKHVKLSLAVGAYTIAQFICTILCSAYTTLLQKVTRYACDYRTY